MIYLDHGATSFPKPPAVIRAMTRALTTCANPGRGGYPAAREAARVVYALREEAAVLFRCRPEQVVLTSSCTHGLNIAVNSLVQPGARVAVSGFEHNAVMRPLYARGAHILVCGRRLFDPADTLADFARALADGVDAAIFTHVSNVFGYRLPLGELAALCRTHGVPFAVDCAQSAGHMDIDFTALGADFIAMPGHKGLLGPQGTGLLLCANTAQPLLYGGTGTQSIEHTMPEELPERLEAGTVNVPGAAGLLAGLREVRRLTPDAIGRHESRLARECADGLRSAGMEVFSGPTQGGTVSFRAACDCEEAARRLADGGFAVRAGLHCAPLAHESAGTLETGTVRVSFGHASTAEQCRALIHFVQG